MTHLELYSESAGQLWRQVNKGEMATRITGQVVDTFTGAEVQRVITLCMSLVRVGTVSEYNMHVDQLGIQVFHNTATKLRVHPLGPFDERYASKLPVPANNLLITSTPPGSEGLFDKYKAYTLDIFKSAEDWLFVGKFPYNEDFQDEKWFVCDGLTGLLSMLREVMGT